MKKNSKHLQRAVETIGIEIHALQQLSDQLDESFDKAIQAMLEAIEKGRKIVVTGMGKSLHIGQKAAATFTSTGCPAVTLHPSEAMHGDLGIIADGDCVLALSYSGASDELLMMMPAVKRKTVTLIAITGAVDSPLAKVSDLVLNAHIEREACPFGMAPTASTTAALALCDALAMALLQARGLQKEDYAKFHPGGAIGRSLLLKVADIMRTDDRLAWVHTTATVKEALVKMTGARAGVLAVLNDREQVCGVFTDGDLRRHLSASNDLQRTLIEDVMTRDPLTVRADDLAIDVLDLFKKHNIDDLLVTDGDGKLAGVVDIQDLPKLKLL